MAVAGICQSCSNIAPGLVSCKSCGSRVCHNCMDPKSGFCKLCGGTRKIG